MHFRFTHPKGIIHLFRVISLYNSYVWSPLSSQVYISEPQEGSYKGP